jgi:hypothetical protein
MPTVPLCHHQMTFFHSRATVDCVASIFTSVPVLCCCSGCSSIVDHSVIDQVVDATSLFAWCPDSGCHALGIHALMIMTVKRRHVLTKRRENVFIGKKKD